MDNTALADKDAAKLIILSMGLFASVSGMFKEIAVEVDKQNNRLVRLESNLEKLFIDSSVFEAPVATPTTKPSVSALKDNKKNILDKGLLAALLSGVISKKSKEHIASLLKIVLNGDLFKKFASSLSGITGIFKKYFSKESFKRLGTIFSSFIRLGTLLAALSLLTNDTADATFERDRSYRDKLRRERERRREQLERRKKSLEKIKKAKRLISGVASALKGTALFAIAGIALDVGFNSFIDYLYSKEEKEIERLGQAIENDEDLPTGDVEFSAEDITKIIGGNVIEALTFHLITGGTLKNTAEVLKGNKEVIRANQEEISGRSVGEEGFNFVSPDYSTDTNKTPIIQKEKNRPEDLPPEFQRPVLDSMFLGFTPGEKLNTNSEVISSTRKKVNRRGRPVVVNNNDNSTVIIQNSNKPVSPSTSQNITPIVGTP